MATLLDPARAMRLRVLLWHVRRPTRVLAALVALAVVAGVLAPPDPSTAAVVVAARPVAAGAELTGADVRLRRLPVTLVPEGALQRVADVEGRTALHALARGLPLTPSVIGGDRFDVAPPPGHVVAAVRLTDDPGTLLRPGDVVELVAAGAHDAAGRASAEVVSSRALVLAVHADEEVDGLLASGSVGPPTTLLALTPADGRRLAALREGAPLTALLVP